MDALPCWAAFPSQVLLLGVQEVLLCQNGFKLCSRVPLMAMGPRPQTVLCHWML